ncbi:MAG: two-component regulator propeller domain-containing protein [Saprospiraceae bacterium]
MNVLGPIPDPFLDGQISAYVRRIFQDRNGALWFGTNSDGVCRYDGNSLTYFTTTEGFGGYAVRGITEDASGNLWFATDGGISRYDISRANNPCNNNTCKHDMQTEPGLKEHSRELAKSFTNYTTKDGLINNGAWCVLIDKTGNFWFGTEGGVSRFNGAFFTNFPIPEADHTDFPHAYPFPKLINCIFQDKKGILWFGSNGNGVYRYDGQKLTNLSTKEGLCDNFVQCILEDKNGTLWFGTRFGGLSRYDPKSEPAGKSAFTNYAMKQGLKNDFVWTLLEDKNAPEAEVGIWVSSNGGGPCKYESSIDGFTHFSDKVSRVPTHVQSFFKDKAGTLWFGCSGGLHRLDPATEAFINVKRSGPWE